MNGAALQRSVEPNLDEFDYLLDKVAHAPFSNTPFRHLHIQDFLSAEHFREVATASQIALPPSNDPRELIERLEKAGYGAIPFPGCVTSKEAYLAWLAGKDEIVINKACEGFGMALRLTVFENRTLAALNSFFNAERTRGVLMEKFGITANVTIDAGIQKYLRGYEISPHPDIRRKALTWMLNATPGGETEKLSFHTHYMRFLPQWRYIERFWEDNPDVDRCWVPWSWCETVFQQTANNSIVLFAPSNSTLHAIRADYDHLATQRTQFYGNLWYADNPDSMKMSFEDLDIKKRLSPGVRPSWSDRMIDKARRLMSARRDAGYVG